MSLLEAPLTITTTLADAEHSPEQQDLFDRVLTAQPLMTADSATTFQARPRHQRAAAPAFFFQWNTLIPMPGTMRGVCLRIVLSQQEAQQGIIALDSALLGLVPQQEAGSIQWLDENGLLLSAPLAQLVEIHGALGKTFCRRRTGVDLGHWMIAHCAQPGDSVLVTVEEWAPKRFRLELEPQQVRRDRQGEIQGRNQELAELLYALLEDAPDGSIYVPETMPTVYAHLCDATSYPGDHWIRVVEQDPRMELLGTTITYAGCYSALDHLFECLVSETSQCLDDPEPPEAKPERLAYRFRVSPRQHPGLCRRIEIEDQQTLGYLDFVLRDAFGQLSTEHACSFRLLAGSDQGSLHELDLGEVDPYEGGSAADRTISELGLNVRARLLYVFDALQETAHEIELEAVGPVDPAANYPRIVTTNTT